MIAILVILQTVFFGIITTYFFKLKLQLEERFAYGVVIGLVWIGFFTFITALFIGLNALNIIFFVITTYILIVLVYTKENGEFFKKEYQDFSNRLKNRSWQIYWLILITFIVLFGYLGVQFFTFKNDHYYIQPVHSYGDISLHLSLISSFAYGDNFPPESPILAGEKISYPFMIDFINAVFINPLGLSLAQSITLTEILLITSLIVIFAFFVLRLTGSMVASVIAIMLLVFNGGLGFLVFFEDFNQSGSSFWNFLTHLQKDYTALKDDGFWWINIFLSMLLPQRSFLLGFPLALIIIRILWDVSEKFNPKSFSLSILLVSLLPLIHTHSLIALSPFILWFTFLIVKDDLKRLKYVVPIAVLGLLITIILSSNYLQQSTSPLEMIKVHIGWTNKGEDLLTFYFKNFGLILLLIPISLVWGLRQKMKLAVFVFIAQLWFVLPSIFIFQPWDFDNIKLLIYWYAFSVILVAFFLSQIIKKLKSLGWVLVIILMCGLTCSGALDVFRLITSSGTRFEIYSPQAIKVAEFIKTNTAPDRVFLSVDKFDNPAVALAGRKVVLGYKTWAWSYGLDFFEKDQDLRLMLNGQGNNLFDKYNIKYIILFNEPTDYIINQEYFNQNFKLIYNQDGYLIYEY